MRGLEIASVVTGIIAVLCSKTSCIDTNVWDFLCVFIYHTCSTLLILVPIIIEYKRNR